MKVTTRHIKIKILPYINTIITHISFSELATNLVFKIINKEAARNNKYGESLILFLLPNPQDNGYSNWEILKTYATSYLKQK